MNEQDASANASADKTIDNNKRSLRVAIIELIESYAAYYRQKAHGTDDNEAPKEGPIAKLTGWSTFAAAILAFIAAVAFWFQFIAMHQANIDANRAWVSVPGLIQMSGSNVGDPIMYAIIERNPGREPALDVSVRGLDNDFVDGADATDRSYWEKLHLPDACESSITIHPGTVIFPTTDPISDGRSRPIGPFERVISTDVRMMAVIPPEMIQGKTLLYVRGCIRYKTMGVIGKTRFCKTVGIIRDVIGNVEGWEFGECASGNWAE
jgi:hypothetical protein